MKELVEHLNINHGQHLEYEHLEFKCRDDLNEWQIQIEKETPCRFKRKTGRVPEQTEYFYCNRSGSSNLKPDENRKRHLKTQGSCKIERNCTAHFTTFQKTADCIEVKYMAKHFCHTNIINQLGHLRLHETERKWLAGKLAQNIPIEIILRDIRLDLDVALERSHIVTKQDLRNIQQAFHLNRPERFHSNDATSVHALVKHYEGESKSPIILYKRQGSDVLDICHEGRQIPSQHHQCLENDFLFGMMDDAQCDMLQRYGSGEMSVICVDSTHGTNGYDFHLTTVMVLDSNRQGFPVAFLYSNRETEQIFKLFFESIKAKSGIIRSNAFMSDMAPQFCSAWQNVMGECDHKLFCAWHVDKGFRENVRRLIKDNAERAVLLYKQLRAVMDEQDVVTFERLLPELLIEIENNPTTAEFAKFFKTYYVPHVKSWAYCYRSRCGINTNMHLERMHGIFKHIYQRGKKNKRLDSAIAALLSMVRDKQFDRITSLCKGKYTKKLSQLRDRHVSSLHCMNQELCTVEVSPCSEWAVQSQTNTDEMYTVKRVMKSCFSCELVCTECCACIHLYTCTCADNAIHFNMCKHIHLVCQKYVVNLSRRQEEQNSDEDNSMIMETEGAHCISEAAAHITRLSRPISTVEQKRQKAMQLCSDAVLIVQEAQTNEQLDVIIDCMKTIRPKLEAVIASSRDSINFVPMPQSLNEPSNKGVEHQRRFVSTKRKRAKMQNGMTKPSVADRREIQNDLIFGNHSNPTEPVDHEEPTSFPSQQTPSDLSTVCNKRLKLASENITPPENNKTLLQLQPFTVFPEYLVDISERRSSISQMRTEISKPCTVKQIVTISFRPKSGPPPKVHIVSTK